MWKVFNPSLKVLLMLTFFLRSQKESDSSLVCFVLQVHWKKPIQYFLLKVSIKKATYCQLFSSFCRSHQMFDVFIEFIAWFYWLSWWVLPIICNSKHFSFFVLYFNVSNKISSTSPWVLSFQFSKPPYVYSNSFFNRYSRVD